jgi:hypothetical protein
MDPYEPTAARSPFISTHLPLTLLGLAAVMFFVAQLGNIRQGTDNMAWQSTNADKVIKSLSEARDTLDKNIETRKALVAQSEQLQKQFTDLMKELDVLARGGDKDAEMIIKGYGIKVNDAPGGSSTPAPAPAAAPAAAPAPAPAETPAPAKAP